MDVDEFVKRVPPAARTSVLAPWIEAIKTLRSGGYTLDQVLDFLRQNEVVISRSGLSAYLRRQVEKTDAKEAKPKQPREAPAPAPARRQPAAPAPPEDREPEATPAGSHNPADLNKIISDKPDLAALAKLASNGRKKK